MNTRQGGSTTVEFALVFLLFLMFLLGVLDFSRMLYTWQSANAATRTGARYAVVCAAPGNNAQDSRKDETGDARDCDDQRRLGTGGVQFQHLRRRYGIGNGRELQMDLADSECGGQPLIMALPNLPTYLPREMMTYNAQIC